MPPLVPPGLRSLDCPAPAPTIITPNFFKPPGSVASKPTILVQSTAAYATTYAFELAMLHPSPVACSPDYKLGDGEMMTEEGKWLKIILTEAQVRDGY